MCLQIERQHDVTKLLWEAVGAAIARLTGGRRAEEVASRPEAVADPIGMSFRKLQQELEHRRQLLQAYSSLAEVSTVMFAVSLLV